MKEKNNRFKLAKEWFDIIIAEEIISFIKKIVRNLN